MLIDNFDIIKEHLNFDDTNSSLSNSDKYFYFVQIVRRSKDNPEMNRYLKPIKSYYIFSKEELDRKKQEIIDICNLYNARCYMDFNRLSLRDVIEKNDKIIKEYQKRGGIWLKKIIRSFDTACVALGTSNANNEFYLVDIDEPNKLDEITNNQFIKNKVFFSLQTIYGNHIIIKQYKNRKEFFENINSTIDVNIVPYCYIILYSNVKKRSIN